MQGNAPIRCPSSVEFSPLGFDRFGGRYINIYPAFSFIIKKYSIIFLEVII